MASCYVRTDGRTDSSLPDKTRLFRCDYGPRDDTRRWVFAAGLQRASVFLFLIRVVRYIQFRWKGEAERLIDARLRPRAMPGQEPASHDGGGMK